MSQVSTKLSARQYVRAVVDVAALSFRTAPAAISFKIVGAVIEALLPIATTYFAAQTTTQLAAAFAGDKAAGNQALTLVVVTAALGMFTTVWSSIDGYIQQLMRYRVEAKVSDIMYERFLSLDFWRYDDKETADLYERAQKFSQFYAYVFDQIANILQSAVSLVSALIALAVFLPWVALCVLAAVIPGMVIQFRLSREQAEHWNRNVSTRRSKSYIEWNLLQPKSIAELRLNGLVRHLLDLRQKLRDRDEHERLKHERSYMGKRLAADAIEAGTELGALVWTVLEIIARHQPIGQFVFVQQMVSRAMGGANSLVRQFSAIDEDLANLVDYQKFMELPTRRGGSVVLDGAPEVIKFCNVSFCYPQSRINVIKDMNLEIRRGQHVAIVGENGAGKTTLVKLLTGLYRPAKGQILLDGIPLDSFDITSWHSQLSVLQQDFEQYVFADVGNNVYFGDVSRPRNESRVTHALKQAEAYEFVEKLPQKRRTYPSPWMEGDDKAKGMALSGGQWQRLALARNFYRDAPIIVLDEPTSAIDALAEARIFGRLFAKSQPKTIITISHRLSTVEKADLIVVMKNGQIAEVGNHADLVAKKSHYYTMFESQIAG